MSADGGAPQGARVRAFVRMLSALAAGVLIGALFAVYGSDHTPRPSDDAPRASQGAVTATVTTGTIRSASPGEVFEGGLFTEPWSGAATAEKALRARNETEAADAAAVIAKYPVAVWLSSFYDRGELVELIERDLAAAERMNQTPVFVTYDIPFRDCGGKSAGGAADADEYLDWNQLIADTLQGHRAVVLVEPDSLGQLSLCPSETADRTETIRSAVNAFYHAGIPTYLDGGNSSWISADTMAKRLQAAGVDRARGFFTNVANYQRDEDERRYAENLSDLLGGQVHYVIDTGRNGQGWRGTWCNGRGAGLGRPPEIAYDSERLDAFLWVKTPGASDGRCTDGPGPGKWFASYAVDLVKNRNPKD